MKRLSPVALAILSVCSFSIVGCGGGGSGSGGGGGGGGGGGTTVPQLKKDGASCTGATGSGAECSGTVCIALNTNDQHEAGICTTVCTTSCAANELCVSGFPDGNNYCLRACTTGADCLDGFACVQDQSTGISFCFVTTGGGGGGGAGGGGGGGTVDCAGAGCALLDATAYCGNVTGATQACDCPSGSPAASCSAAVGAANVWCCP